MEIARWLIVFVAFITGTGGLFADYVIPASAAQHIEEPTLAAARYVPQRSGNPPWDGVRYRFDRAPVPAPAVDSGNLGDF
jgi:hypothetical protein